MGQSNKFVGRFELLSHDYWWCIQLQFDKSLENMDSSQPNTQKMAITKLSIQNVLNQWSL